MEETENVQLKPESVRFQISGFLNIFIDFFMDFTEGVQDFRVIGDPPTDN